MANKRAVGSVGKASSLTPKSGRIAASAKDQSVSFTARKAGQHPLSTKAETRGERASALSERPSFGALHVLGHPLLPKGFILAAHRPGAAPSSDAPLRTLKHKGLLSEGVEMIVRLQDSGRLSGTARLYCALNRDAARLARHGDGRDAQRLAKKARQLETSKHCRHVVSLFNEMKHVRTGWEAYLDALDDREFRNAVLAFATDVEEARSKDPAAERATVSLAGAVVSFRGRVAQVQASDGTAVPVDRARLARLGLNWIGAPIIIHREDDKASLIVQLEPGVGEELRLEPGGELLPVGDDVPEKVDAYAYGGFRLRTAEASEAFEALLATPPAS